MSVLKKVSKAIGAGVSAGISAYLLAKVGGLTVPEWGGVIGTVLFAFGATYLAPANAT